MFYLPEEQNSQYSEGFRKLIKRVIGRIKKQQLALNLNPQQKKKISYTVDHDENFFRKRKQLQQSERRKHLLSIKEGITDGSTKSSNKILLPKLKSPNQRLNIRGEELSSKFIRSSDKQIRKLLHQITNEIPAGENSKNIHYSIKRKPIRSRKLKSECIELNYFKQKSGEVEQITPWALNSTSSQNFFNRELLKQGNREQQ